jgi:hypothetical protein
MNIILHHQNPLESVIRSWSGLFFRQPVLGQLNPLTSFATSWTSKHSSTYIFWKRHRLYLLRWWQWRKHLRNFNATLLHFQHETHGHFFRSVAYVNVPWLAEQMDSASFTCTDCESSNGMRECVLLCDIHLQRPCKTEQGWATDRAQLLELYGKKCIRSGPTRNHGFYSLCN